MSQTSVVERVKPSLEVLRVEGPDRLEALGHPVDALTVTIRRGGLAEAVMALSSVDLAACLGYATGAKALGNLIRRHSDELAVWIFSGSELSKYAAPQIEGPHSERVWVVGPGLDLVLMLSSQPAAKAFRAWLSERSLELRTKGVTYAAPELQRSAEASADSRATEAMARALELTARMTERTLAVLERMEARFVPPRSLLPPEPRFDDSPGEPLSDGCTTAQELAIRCGWYSAASGGTLPHPEAVVVAALNDGFALDPGAFSIRRRVVERGDGPMAVEQRVFTRHGTERFVRAVAPRYAQFEAFEIDANYLAIRSGKRGRMKIVRRVAD